MVQRRSGTAGVKTKSRNAGNQLPQVPASNIRSLVGAEEGDENEGSVKQWLEWFGSDRYHLLGTTHLVRDLLHLIDPIFSKCSNAFNRKCLGIAG